MALATWWRSDSLPSLPVVPGFHAAMCDDDAMLAELNRISIEEVRARRQKGHRPYVGRLQGMPVAYGWVATRSASIGELNLTITLSQRDRYLWDFATLPAWQGRGLYPVKGSLLTNEWRPDGRNSLRPACQDALMYETLPHWNAIRVVLWPVGVSPDGRR